MENKELTLYVDPAIEEQAEKVLDRLGVSLSTAVNMYFNQIVMTDSIPFDVKVTETPEPKHACHNGDGEIQAKIRQGYDDYNAGRMADSRDLLTSTDPHVGEH
jgi:addiction module RelB/DinJ family antitoxin